MKEKINILIVGNAYSPHISRIIKQIYQNTDLINIDFCNYSKEKDHKPDISNLCNNIYYKKTFFPIFLYRIPKLNTILSLLDFKYTIKKKVPHSYDIINIHYITIDNVFCSRLYKKKSKVLVLSAWGSDILRASFIKIHLLRNLYKRADYYTHAQTGFRDKVQSIFKFPDSKIIDVKFGSDMIDLLKSNQNLDKNESKKRLGFEDKYIITIAYNGSEAQNHLKVIEQINLVKDSLPNNLLLMLPMTYPEGNKYYIDEVKSIMEAYKLPYIIYDSYLTNEKLLLVRKCTDVFIHAQLTDASAASVQEYMLVNCIVLNASWLEYAHLEKYGKPYFTFDNLEEIGESLLYAIENQNEIKVSEDLKVDLYNRGWDKAISTWISFYLNTSKNL